MDVRKIDDSESKDSRLGMNTLRPGAILQDRYEVIKVLGVGGMGAVYQARDLRFSGIRRLCAVKEMIFTARDEFARNLATQAFEREANILAMLNHPAIPTIHDYFTEDVRNYLVMEHIEGLDLEAVLKSMKTPLPVDRVTEWAIQTCDVLSYLHSQTPPIIFRDLKPSNIMIRRPNQIVLVDFGIARVFSSEEKGTMIGTEGYSPPEQYRGVASPRGDIYALGATLHHLLTRRDPRLHPPFTFHEVSISQSNPDVSEELDSALMKALEYEPEKRYASAGEMKETLSRFIGQGGGKTQAPSTAQEAAPGSKSPRATKEGVEEEPGDKETPAAQVEGPIQPLWRFQCEDEVRSSPVLNNGILYVGSYDHHLYALRADTGKLAWKYATDGGIAATPCVWKDRVLIGSEDWLLYAISAQTGRILWTCPTEGRVRSSAFVEFQHVFFGSDDFRLYNVNAQTGRVMWRFQAMDCIRATPVVGEEIVYVGSEDGYLYAVDLQNGRQRWKFRTNRGITSSPIMTDGLIIFGSADWNVYAVDEQSGWSAWRFRTQQAVIGSPRAEEGVVYIGSADGFLYALDAKRGRQVWKYNAESQVVSTPAVTEDAIYFGTIAGDVVSVDKNGKERWRFTTGGAVPSSPWVAEGVVYVGSNDGYVYALPA